MVKIRLYRGAKEGEWDGIEMSGHANSADYGQDLVCASLSGIAIYLANTIMESQALASKFRTQVESGYLQILRAGELSQEERKISQVLFDGFAINMAQLAKQYPQYIQIQNVEAFS